ncbi:MAG: hypothetical protein ACUVV6_00620 [Thermoplasmatota archaeon]
MAEDKSGREEEGFLQSPHQYAQKRMSTPLFSAAASLRPAS